ncbi:unnamed protein product [Urochloa decumbens]|uniref:Uncharacterized protein n=1 Tax=Urochloa decumbens TaxID=240449 RepID=A0ABC8YC28_9POAL
MGSGASIASSSQLAPMGLAAAAIVCRPAGLAAGAIFGAGVAVGAAWTSTIKDKPTDDDDAAAAALDALDAVGGAAEAVIEYLRAAKDAAARALEKLEQAAASVEDRVARLVSGLFGLKNAAAARHEMRRAARHAGGGPEALAKAAARVARSRRCITEAAVASSAIVPAAGGARASAPLPESVSNSDAAMCAARIAAEMMRLILEVFVAGDDMGDSIPPAARAFIAVIAAAVVLCLDIVAGHSDDDL